MNKLIPIDNKELLNSLSEEERALAFSLLKDISSGDLTSLNELKYADFKEIPVDINTFLDSDNYMGKAWKDGEGNSKLFPTWREVLNQLFPDNLTTDVNTLLESGARGIGKSENACGAAAAYLMYRVMCLKNPLEYYGLKPTEKIVFAFMNITQELAKRIAVEKFQKSIQMSPWFMSKGKMTSFDNSPYWLPPDPISIVIGSQSSDVIGQPIFFAFFDEISFIKNMDVEKQKAKAIDMIDTAIGGMKTRFVRGGKDPTLLVIASSKRSEQSFMETHIKDKLASEPDNVIVVDKPVWEVQPRSNFSKETFRVALGNKYLVSQVLSNDEPEDPWIEKGYKILIVPETFRAKFIEDIDRALCDYAGISSSELSKYISGAIVQERMNKSRLNPFTQEILEIGNSPDDRLQYYNFFDLSRIPEDLINKPMTIHLDMSLSGDKSGIGGTFIAGKKPSSGDDQSKDLYYKEAFHVSIKAPKGRQISFEKNRNFIRWLKQRGFNIIEISADTFQSADLLQILSSEGFNTSVLSVDRVGSDRVCAPYQSFKNALYEGRYELLNGKLSADEISDLERNLNTGKVDHPPNGSKDAADALCGSMFIASKYADKYGYDYGEAYETLQAVNDTEPDIEDINKSFEEELKNTFSFGKNILNKSDYINSGLTPPEEEIDDLDSGLLIM